MDIVKGNKGLLSQLFYGIGIGLSFINPWLGMGMYFIVAAMWFIPDKRVESSLAGGGTGKQ